MIEVQRYFVISKYLVGSRALIVQKFELVVVGSGSSVDAAADDEDAGSIDREANGVRRPVPGVPSSAVACSGKPGRKIE